MKVLMRVYFIIHMKYHIEKNTVQETLEELRISADYQTAVVAGVALYSIVA